MSLGERLTVALGGSAVVMGLGVLLVLMLRRHLLQLGVGGVVLLLVAGVGAQAQPGGPFGSQPAALGAGCVQPAGLAEELGGRLGYELGQRAGEALGLRPEPAPRSYAERVRDALLGLWGLVKRLWQAVEMAWRLGDFAGDFLDGAQGLPLEEVLPGGLEGGCAPCPGSGVQLAREAARAAGFTGADLEVAVRVANAESDLLPRVTHTNTNGTVDRGLWQVNSVHADLLPGDWTDPFENARDARAVWQRQGWLAWTTYRDGTYLTKPLPESPCLELAAMTGPEGELSGNAARGRRAVLTAFPGTTVGGWGERPNATEHDDRDPVTGRKASRAIDVMTYTDTEKGDRVARFVLEHWEALRVQYLIWDRRIWSAPDAPRPYRGPSPHTDHPHITFLPDGGNV